MSPSSWNPKYVFCYGTAFGDGLRQLTTVTGAAPLMPHAAYGVWWSQCCPKYTSSDFDRTILREYRNRSLPLSVVVLDMDWHTEGWNHYTWDPQAFPSPADFVGSLHSGASGYGRPLKLALNIHPGGYEITAGNEANYAAFAAAMGADPSRRLGWGCDMFNKTYAAALMATMLDPTGMDYYWDDCYACTWRASAASADGRQGGSCGDGASVGADAKLWSAH
eukprot:gene10822-16360_t